jgi:hypothetical protein
MFKVIAGLLKVALSSENEKATWIVTLKHLISSLRADDILKTVYISKDFRKGDEDYYIL